MDMKYKIKSSIQSNRLMERRYRQVLEEEQKSLARNKKLLEDIDRLEEQMKYFHSEYKQDEKRLKQAKDKFMQYVKSVYPKWTEDVKKWQAAKKRDILSKSDQNRISVNPQSEFHSTRKRNQLGFTDSERSISHSGLLEEDSPKKRDVSLEYPRNIVENPRDMMGYPSDGMGYSRDGGGYPKDRVSYPGDAVVSSWNRMEYPREIAASRERMNHSREMGFPNDTMGYSRNDMGFPRETMHNGAPWMYPHHSPTGLFPPIGRQYFLPMPVYGVPRWSTPGYSCDHWSMSQRHDRNYHDEFSRDEPCYFTKDVKERSQDVPVDGDKGGRKGGMQSEALPNARNSEYDPEQRTFCEVNSHRENFTGNHTAENMLDHEIDQVKPSADVRREYHDPSQGQDSGRLHQEPVRQLSEERKGGYERNVESRTFPNDNLYVEERRENHEVAPSFRAQDGSKFVSRDRELVEDDERSQDLEKKKTQPHRKGELNDWVASKYDRIEHEPQSKRFGSSHQIKSDAREYLDEHRKETRVMQLRSEGSRYGSREALNTDSVSLPTIHQYEGDIHDVFSDISSSEPLNQDGSSRIDTKRSKSKDTQELEPKVSQKDDVGTTKKMLTKEDTESKPSVVEDLIGDDASDFQISEAELSEDDLVAKEVLSSTLVAGSVVERLERSTGPEVGDRSSAAPNEAAFKETTAGQSGFENERIPHHKEVEQSDILNEDMVGDKGTRKNMAANEKVSQHTKIEGSSPSREDANDLGEVLEIEKGTSKENDLEKSANQKFSHERDDLGISEDLPATDTLDNAQRDTQAEESKMKTGVRDSEDLNDMKVDITKDGKDESEHLEVGEKVEKKNDQSTEENVKEVHTDDGAVVSEDEKSKSGVLEEVSFSTEESSSEGLPAPEKRASKKSERSAKERVSYSEDFEDEKSVPLTQSAAYQKMLSTVDVSDEGEDIEEDFLEGTMSEANTTAQSTQNMPKTPHDSGTPPQIKQLAKSSKSKPTLSLFSSGERDDFGNSFGKENDGVLSGSWKSSVASLSPPLSLDTPRVPEADKEDKTEEERGNEKRVSVVGETKDETEKNQAKSKESDTKSRIQAGFWNHSESESEVDLQISHGGNDNNNDDDDDFDFYS